jgi:hypothetical protein
MTCKIELHRSTGQRQQLADSTGSERDMHEMSKVVRRGQPANVLTNNRRDNVSTNSRRDAGYDKQ